MKYASLNLKKAFLLFFLGTLSFFSRAQETISALENSLKKADLLYNENPQQAIRRTKQLYTIAVKKKFELQELKSIKYLAYFYMGTQDMEQAMTYTQKGIEIAKKYKIDSLTGDFLVLNGVLDQIKNQYALAMINYKQAIPYYEKNKQEKRIASTWVNIGICEMKLSDFETANRYFLQSAAVFDRLKDILNLSSVYNSVGVCFSSLGDPAKSLNYHRKALATRQQLQHATLQAQSMNNIGLAFIDQKRPDSALFYLYRCLAIRKKEKDSSILILTLQNIGTAYQQKGDLKQAMPYLLRSLNLAEKYNRKEDAAKAKLDLAVLYMKQNNPKQALQSVHAARLTAIQLNQPELVMNADEIQYQIYEKKGDYMHALLYHRHASRLKDSLFSLAKNKRIAELEIQYQTVKKENDIHALSVQNALQKKAVEQQRLFILALIVSALLLLSLLIVAYLNYRIKNKANQRIQTLMHELNHRVKNNLQILSGLFSLQIHELSDETAKNALRENETRLASMNLIHHKLYHNPANTKIEMQEYLVKLLEHIKNSFGSRQTEKVQLQIDVKELFLEADTAVAIGLIVNELTTNAMKYAFDSDGGQIYLKLQQLSANSLLLILGDNGKGIISKEKTDGSSFGLKLVHMMAKQLRSSISIKNGPGTRYEMEIKI